jgi:uncharacterized ion transporter superfamily protein YfcC
MMCNYRIGDAIILLALMLAMFVRFVYVAISEKSTADGVSAVFLFVVFIVGVVLNNRARKADDIRMHREMQQRLLGSPPEEVF